MTLQPEDELELYKAVYDNSPGLCFILDETGKILDVNKACAQSLGCTTSELMETSILDLLDLETWETLQGTLINAGEQLIQAIDCKIRSLHPSRSALWVRLNLSGLPRSSSIFILYGEDVTQIREFEEKLRHKEKQFRLVTDSLAGKVSYVDSQKRYQYVSQQYGEWSKVSSNEIVGQTVEGFMGTSAYPRVQKYVEAALSGEKVTYEVTWNFADGSERYLTVNYIPDIAESGEILGFYAIMQDLTESKKVEKILHQFNASLEQQVRERTAQLQQTLVFETVLKRITEKVRDTLDESQILQVVVEQVALGLGCHYCDTSLYNINQGTASVYCAYITSTTSARRHIAFSDFFELYSQLLQGQCLQFCEIVPTLIRSAQEQLAILVCPISDGQEVLGDLRLCHQKDDAFEESEVRLMQQVASQCAIALRQARLYRAQSIQVEKLEELNQLKDDFLSTISHELRTPVTNMKMAIQMLSLTLGRDQVIAEQDRVNRYLQILQDECTREARLINNLLDLQRLESKEPALTVEPILLEPWLLKLLEPFQERTQDAQQKLQLDIPAGMPPFVSDPVMLERILTELLNNACKYTPAGEQIVLSVHTCAQGIQVRVTNFGVEIPAAYLERIFDKFYRVPSSDPWRQGGTGLGLALTHKLVEHLEGAIWVESHSGQTIFTIELPALPDGDGT